MSLDVESLFVAMAEAGRSLAGGVWSTIQTYALPELRKIATQIVAIGENIGDFSLDGAKALLAMQVDAAVAVIAAATEIAMLKVREAIAEILGAVRNLVNAALPIPLL